MELANYIKLYGDIVFPGDSRRADVVKKIQAGEGRWMFSHEGIRWVDVTCRPEKICWKDDYFREIPEGIEVGATANVRANTGSYQYSHDNGHRWIDLGAREAWLFHGNHDNLWFRKKANV